MITLPDTDLASAIASLICGNATKAQQSRAYRYMRDMDLLITELRDFFVEEVRWAEASDIEQFRDMLNKCNAVLAKAGAEQ